MKAVRLYAQVLVDVAVAPGSNIELGKVLQELSEFSKMFAESPMFGRVFESPAIGEDEKQKVLGEFSSKVNLSVTAARFLSILIKRGRMKLLPEILKEAEVIEIEKRGGLIGEIVSAIPLEGSIVSGISEALSKRLKKPVQLKQKLDTALIAGMRVTLSGVTYDGTVKGKLEKLSGLI
jgi:hypothetical protein